jgi:hypothetical protein
MGTKFLINLNELIMYFRSLITSIKRSFTLADEAMQIIGKDKKISQWLNFENGKLALTLLGGFFIATVRDSKKEIKEVRQELKQEMKELKEELKGEITGVRQEMNVIKTEMKTEMNIMKTEMKEMNSEIHFIKGLLVAKFGSISASNPGQTPPPPSAPMAANNLSAIAVAPKSILTSPSLVN